MAHKESAADESSANTQFVQLVEIISSLDEELMSI